MVVYERFCIDNGRTTVYTDLYKRATVSESKFLRYQDREAVYPDYVFGRALAAVVDPDEGAFVLLQRYRVTSRSLGTSWKIAKKGGMGVVPLDHVVGRCVALRANVAKTAFVSADCFVSILGVRSDMLSLRCFDIVIAIQQDGEFDEQRSTRSIRWILALSVPLDNPAALCRCVCGDSRCVAIPFETLSSGCTSACRLRSKLNSGEEERESLQCLCLSVNPSPLTFPASFFTRPLFFFRFATKS